MECYENTTISDDLAREYDDDARFGCQREHTTDYRGAAAAPLPGAATV